MFGHWSISLYVETLTAVNDDDFLFGSRPCVSERSTYPRDFALRFRASDDRHPTRAALGLNPTGTFAQVATACEFVQGNFSSAKQWMTTSLTLSYVEHKMSSTNDHAYHFPPGVQKAGRHADPSIHVMPPFSQCPIYAQSRVTLGL